MQIAHRRFTVVVCALALLAGACRTQHVPDGSLRRLTILHTNDLHATLLPLPDGRGGFARLATALKRERAQVEASLYLDGGDLVQGSPVSTLFEGLPIFEFGNELGIDAAALGNHEFDYGWERIRDFQKTARFPLIAANVVNDAGRMLTPPGYVIREAGGVRVGIIGAATEETNRFLRPRHLGPWRAAPVVPVVAELAAMLRPQVDLVIVLGHLDRAEDEEILREVPEVSLVISGHNHIGRIVPYVVEDRFGVKLQSNGRELGRIDLAVDIAADRIVSWNWRRIPIDAELPPDDRMSALIAAWEGQVSKIVDVPIGEARSELGGDTLRHLLEQALVDQTGADIAYLNPGGIRAGIPKGTILARHVWNVLPFDNTVVLADVKGADLPEDVRNEQRIDPSRTYRFATADFLAETDFAKYRLPFGPPGKLTRDLAIEWIRKKRRIG